MPKIVFLEPRTVRDEHYGTDKQTRFETGRVYNLPQESVTHWLARGVATTDRDKIAAIENAAAEAREAAKAERERQEAAEKAAKEKVEAEAKARADAEAKAKAAAEAKPAEAPRTVAPARTTTR